MNRDVAAVIVEKSLSSYQLLGEVVFLVGESCSEEEAAKIRQGVARAIGYMDTFVLERIFKESPDLRDYELKGGE
ncbi:MAG: hypothetical protein COA42_22810 [Alteromonadaceae bacterium]|nr:hypothetical protein [Colwellia sp.]PCK01718.1 MAG: hypothetical protein COA42_22810 [Alteromonadaceae bacterium]